MIGRIKKISMATTPNTPSSNVLQRVTLVHLRLGFLILHIALEVFGLFFLDTLSWNRGNNI